MSVCATNWVWKNAQSLDLQDSELVILLALADYADDEGIAFPSVPKLAAKTNKHVTTIQRALARLAKVGVIEKQGRYGRRADRKANVWQILALRPCTALPRSDSIEPESRPSAVLPGENGHEVANTEPRGSASGSTESAPPTPPIENTQFERQLESASAQNPEPQHWWEFPAEDRAGEIAVQVALTIRSAKRYESEEPKERICREVAELMLTAPDLDTANDVLERWVVEVDAAPERALKPGLAAIQLKEWMRSREPKWREIKRAREIDAKFAERGQVPRRKGKESMEQMYERLSRELGEGHAA